MILKPFDQEGYFSEIRDYDAISALMNTEWKLPRWEYSPELLSGYLGRPSCKEAISLGYYHKGKLSGYICLLPSEVDFSGRSLKLMCGTWWTSAKHLAYRGIGYKLMQLAQAGAKERGFDGYICVTHADSYADTANKKVFEKLGLKYQILSTFTQMMADPRGIRRRLENKNPHPGAKKVEVWEPDWQQQILNSTNADFKIRFDAEDAEYMLLKRPKTHTWGVPNKAILNTVLKGYSSEMIVQNAYIEHLNVEGLSTEEQLAFFQKVFCNPMWDQVTAVYIVDSGSIPKNALSAIGFRRTIKKFNLYAIPYDGVPLRNITNFHCEVF